eukprot:Colp12_sorted_trinity150504_noHs@34233
MAQKKKILYHFGPDLESKKARLLLAEKGIEYISREVNILLHQQLDAEEFCYDTEGNCAVPVLLDGVNPIGHQQITDYIEQTYPDPSLTPQDPPSQTTMKQWLEAQRRVNWDALILGHTSSLKRNLLVSNLEARLPLLRSLIEQNPDDVKAEIKRTEEILGTIANPRKLDKLTEDVEKLLDKMDHHLRKKSSWLAGEQYTLADVAWTAVLHTLDEAGLAANLWGQGTT